MKILEGRMVYLEKGEIMPVWCVCGAIYQPDSLYDTTTCPNCKKTNFYKDKSTHGEKVVVN